MTKTLIPAAGYLRMSSDQQDTSIDDQRSELIAYAAKHGFRIVKWYVDEGISGWKSKQRHAFLALVADATEGEFKVVLCWDQSRFSRFKPMEANFYWHQLSEAGVTIETIKEGKLDFDSLGGWLSASVQQHAKAEYCKSLAHDVARGRRRAIAAGKWCWPAPYGYRLNKESGRLVPGDIEQIENLRRIFKLRASGLGVHRICRLLNSENIPAPYGGSWSRTQVQNMLHRETYRGHMICGEELKGKFTHIFDEVQRHENMHEPLIDSDLWRRVQAINAQGRQKTSAGRRPTAATPLAGLLQCGKCGRTMFSDQRRGYYVCGQYHSTASCVYAPIFYEPALQVVATAIRQTVLCGSLAKLTEKIEQVQARRKSSKAAVSGETIKKQLADMDRKLEAAADRVLSADASVVPTLQASLAKLKAQRDALAAKLADVAPAPRKPQTAQQIAAGLWELDKVMAKGDPLTVRAALGQLIDRIELEITAKPIISNPTRNRHIVTGGTIFFSSGSPSCSSLPWRTIRSLVRKRS